MSDFRRAHIVGNDIEANRFNRERSLGLGLGLGRHKKGGQKGWGNGSATVERRDSPERQINLID